MLTPPAPRSSTCAGPGGDTGTSGSMGTSEKCADVVVDTLERGPRGYMPAASQAPSVDEVGEELPRPREDRPGGEERVLLGGKHGNRPPKCRSSSSLAILGRPASSLTHL